MHIDFIIKMCTLKQSLNIFHQLLTYRHYIMSLSVDYFNIDNNMIFKIRFLKLFGNNKFIMYNKL